MTQRTENKRYRIVNGQQAVEEFVERLLGDEANRAVAEVLDADVVTATSADYALAKRILRAAIDTARREEQGDGD